MQSRRGSCHYPCKQTSTVGPARCHCLVSSRLLLLCCTVLSLLPAAILWSWQDSSLQSLVPKTTALSIRPQDLLKHWVYAPATPNASFTRSCKIRNVPMKNYGGPLHVAVVFHMKNDLLFGGRQSWPFCQIASIKGLRQGCSRFLCF